MHLRDSLPSQIAFPNYNLMIAVLFAIVSCIAHKWNIVLGGITYIEWHTYNYKRFLKLAATNRGQYNKISVSAFENTKALTDILWIFQSQGIFVFRGDAL